jgi:cytochrome c556
MPLPVRLCAAVTGLTAATAVAIAAVAHAKEPIVEYRQAVMAAIGGHTGALKPIITGKVPFAAEAKPHAEALAALAGMANGLFPPGSGAESDALPAIWEKPEAFRAALDRFRAAATDLARRADGAPADMAPAFGDLVKACKGCHDDFRKKS